MIMELTVAFIEMTLQDFFRRCELIKLAGGIAMRDVVGGTATVPQGWVLDYATEYYVPPGFGGNTTVQ